MPYWARLRHVTAYMPPRGMLPAAASRSSKTLKHGDGTGHDGTPPAYAPARRTPEIIILLPRASHRHQRSMGSHATLIVDYFDAMPSATSETPASAHDDDKRAQRTSPPTFRHYYAALPGSSARCAYFLRRCRRHAAGPLSLPSKNKIHIAPRNAAPAHDFVSISPMPSFSIRQRLSHH